MILKRFWYENGLDIITPLKCGTRWLEGLDVDTRINKIGLHITELPQHIHSGSIFIWRPVREHMLSALKTELSIHSEKSPFDIVTKMVAGECDHWYSHLYKELYTIWSNTPFRFCKLRALSELTPNAKELKYISSAYDFPLPSKWDSVEAALGSLSIKHTKRLEKLISEEERWLKMMIEPQYSNVDWKTYSDLEDEVLYMKCKVKDLSSEVSRITDSKLFIGLNNTIREVRKANTILQAKLDYIELVMRNPTNKLI